MPRLDDQHDGSTQGDPWLEVLLGLVSLARQVTSEAEPTRAARSTATTGNPLDDALAACLGALALARGFEASLEPWRADPPVCEAALPGDPIGDLLR